MDCECKCRHEGGLDRIGHVLVVLSGKGGVGKSTVAVNLALSLALAKKRVGLLDIDIHGPSIPRMLGLEGHVPSGDEEGLDAIPFSAHLSVFSIGFLLRKESDAVIWRGPRKFSAIKQLLTDVRWGDLDFLVVDAPPGTGDEPLAICELTEGPQKARVGQRGAVIVTTSQGVALTDVRKCISFCHTVGMPIHGLVENMSHMLCPHCSQEIEVFGDGGGESLARESDIPFLGRIPLDPRIMASGEAGRPFVLAAKLDAEGEAELEPSAEVFRGIAARVICRTTDEEEPAIAPPTEIDAGRVRYAIPTEFDEKGGEWLCAHFGHCEVFTMIDVDAASGEIVAREKLLPPPHEPGVLPRWIRDQGAKIVLSGGMGQRAKEMLEDAGVEVAIGVGQASPEELVHAHRRGALVQGENACTH